MYAVGSICKLSREYDSSVPLSRCNQFELGKMFGKMFAKAGNQKQIPNTSKEQILELFEKPNIINALLPISKQYFHAFDPISTTDNKLLVKLNVKHYVCKTQSFNALCFDESGYLKQIMYVVLSTMNVCCYNMIFKL